MGQVDSSTEWRPCLYYRHLLFTRTGSLFLSAKILVIGGYSNEDGIFYNVGNLNPPLEIIDLIDTTSKPVIVADTMDQEKEPSEVFYKISQSFVVVMILISKPYLITPLLECQTTTSK